MSSLPATILWYVFLVGILLIAQRLTRCFSQVNIFSLFFAFLVLRHGITVPFDDNVNVWFANIHVSEWAKERYYLALLLMWIFVLVGIYLGKLLMGNGILKADIYFLEVREAGIPPGMNQAIFLMCVCAIVYLLLAYQVDTSARISDLFLGRLSAEDYRAMRDNSSKVTEFRPGHRESPRQHMPLRDFAIRYLYIVFHGKKGPIMAVHFLPAHLDGHRHWCIIWSKKRRFVSDHRAAGCHSFEAR